jgi:hypothetical protein
LMFTISLRSRTTRLTRRSLASATLFDVFNHNYLSQSQVLNGTEADHRSRSQKLTI